MQITVNGEFEKLIAEQLATGNYRNAEDLLEDMAAAWKARQSAASDASSVPSTGEKTDFSKLAAAQGVKPCSDPRNLQGDGWPAEDTIEEFEAFLRDLRHRDPAERRS